MCKNQHLVKIYQVDWAASPPPTRSRSRPTPERLPRIGGGPRIATRKSPRTTGCARAGRERARVRWRSPRDGAHPVDRPGQQVQAGTIHLVNDVRGRPGRNGECLIERGDVDEASPGPARRARGAARRVERRGSEGCKGTVGPARAGGRTSFLGFSQPFVQGRSAAPSPRDVVVGIEGECARLSASGRGEPARKPLALRPRASSCCRRAARDQLAAHDLRPFIDSIGMDGRQAEVEKGAGVEGTVGRPAQGDPEIAARLPQGWPRSSSRVAQHRMAVRRLRRQREHRPGMRFGFVRQPPIHRLVPALTCATVAHPISARSGARPLDFDGAPPVSSRARPRPPCARSPAAPAGRVRTRADRQSPAWLRPVFVRRA